jgi:hypothetical protein
MLMITVKARFDGRVFIPHEPVDLPADCELDIVISQPVSATAGKSTLARLAEIADKFAVNPDLPSDLAAQHDHYLYGTPKQP